MEPFTTQPLIESPTPRMSSRTPKPGQRLGRLKDPLGRIERRTREKVRTGARDVCRARRERMQRDRRHHMKGTVKDPALKARELRKKKKERRA